MTMMWVLLMPFHALSAVPTDALFRNPICACSCLVLYHPRKYLMNCRSTGSDIVATTLLVLCIIGFVLA